MEWAICFFSDIAQLPMYQYENGIPSEIKFEFTQYAIRGEIQICVVMIGYMMTNLTQHHKLDKLIEGDMQYYAMTYLI